MKPAKIRKYCLFFLVFFLFSCQSLPGYNKSPEIQARLTSHSQVKKASNWASFRSIFNKTGLFKAESNKEPVVIDNDYLDYASDLAYLKAESSFLENDLAGALEYMETAQIFSRDDGAYLLERKADFYKKEGFLTEAIQIYQRSLKKDGTQTRVQKKIMECYVLNDLNELALQENKKLLAQEPDSFLLRFQQVVLLMAEQKWQKSLTLLNQLLSQDLSLEDKTSTLAFQSYALSTLGKEKEALKSYKSLMSLDLPEEAVILRVGDLYRRIGKEKWAINYVRQFQDQGMVTKYNASFLFDVAFAVGDWEQAFQQTEYLEALGNLQNPHRFYRAFYLVEKKNHVASIPYLRDLLIEDPDNGQYQYLLGVSYSKMNELEQAFKNYQKVSDSSPYFLLSQLDLARLLEKQGEQEKSLALLKKLSFGVKMSPFAVSEYAKKLWQIGNKKQALNVLNVALKEDPSNSELLSLKDSYSKEVSFVELEKVSFLETE